MIKRIYKIEDIETDSSYETTVDSGQGINARFSVVAADVRETLGIYGNVRQSHVRCCQ